MLLLLHLCAALAGELVVESRLPAALSLDGTPLARLYRAGTLRVPDLPAGPHELAVQRFGRAEGLQLDLPDHGSLLVLVGARNTVLVDDPPARAASGPGSLELRSVGATGALVVLDGERFELGPSTVRRFRDLAAGPHQVEVRSSDGQLTWSRGRVVLRPGGLAVMLLSEGRSPEYFGPPGGWRPGG